MNRNRLFLDQIVHKAVTAKSIKKDMDAKNADAEKIIQKTIFSKHEKMLIETGSFFEGLCRGMYDPSQF